jgi:hypothetical protein
MKTLGLILAVSIVAWAQTSRPPRPAVASTRIQVVAAIDGANFKPGTPIILKLTVKNVSSQVMKLGDSDPEIDFDCTVTDASGKELPRTDWGNRLLRHEYSLLSARSQLLEPGQQFQAEIDLGHIYRIEQAGSYYARAVHSTIFSNSVNGVDVTSVEESKRPIEMAFSNPVQFVVVP